MFISRNNGLGLAAIECLGRHMGGPRAVTRAPTGRQRSMLGVWEEYTALVRMSWRPRRVSKVQVHRKGRRRALRRTSAEVSVD